MSKVEDEVCDIIQTRAKKVQATDKYAGATMERDDLTHDEWLEHLQHELMDAVIYLQRLRTREQTFAARLREANAKSQWRYNTDLSSHLEKLIMEAKE